MGAAVGVLCLGHACAAPSRTHIADSGRVYREDRFGAAVAAQETKGWATALRVWLAELNDFLDALFEIRLDSTDPAIDDYDAVERRLLWRLRFGSLTSQTIAYAVDATTPGTWPIRRYGYGSFVDTQGGRGLVLLPLDEAVVSVTDRDLQQIVLPWLVRWSGATRTFVHHR